MPHLTSLLPPPSQHSSLFEVPSNVLVGGGVILAGQCGSSLESFHAGLGDRGPPWAAGSVLLGIQELSRLWRQKGSILNLLQHGLSGDREWLVRGLRRHRELRCPRKQQQVQHIIFGSSEAKTCENEK